MALAVLVGFINHLGGHGDERVIAGGFSQALDLILLYLSGRRCRGAEVVGSSGGRSALVVFLASGTVGMLVKIGSVVDAVEDAGEVG